MGLKLGLNNRLFMMVIALGVLSGCAASKGSVDPYESTNRAIFKFNDTLDSYVLKPVAKGYVYITPKFARTGVTNVFSNFKYPLVFTNQFLQGKFKLGVQDLGRFLMNSTLGVAGIFDVAKEFGLEKHDEDFGQTFGTWGFESGPYIVLPLFGPSNVRDGLGSVATYFATPENNLEYFDDHRGTKNKLTALEIINKRAGLLNLEKLASGDKYAFMRDAYMQKRANLVSDGNSSDEEDPFLSDE